jgi:hypothetical protein
MRIKHVTLTMSVPYEDVKSILASKLSLPTASGDPPMAPEMLLHNIGLMEIQRKQAEEGRVVAEEMRRVTEEKHQRTEEALAEANRRLS